MRLQDIRRALGSVSMSRLYSGSVRPVGYAEDTLTAVDLRGSKTRDRGPYIVNTITRHRSGEPVTLITAEQELILVVTVPNHQHKMARSRPHIKNLGNNPVLTANVEKFAITIPAHINSDFFSLPRTWSLDFQARAHT